MSIVARRPGHLGAGWAQEVVRGRAPGARVRRVDVLGVDVGTTTRVRLLVDHDAAGLPHHWFVKLPSRRWRARVLTALPRLGPTEVRCYTSVPDTGARPALIAGAHRRGGGFTLVLADVTERGATAGCPGDTISPDDAGRVVDLVAGLHARWWERLDRMAWLDGPARRLEDRLGAALAVPLMRRGLRRAGDDVPAALRAPALAWARRRRAVMAALERGPRTLVHHDCHAGNLWWSPDGRPGLLDWQLVRAGEGVGDVAYLLATSLTPEDREAHEDSLLARYAAGLAAAGGPALALDDLRERYRGHLTYAFEAMVVTLAVGGLMDETAVRALVRRTAAAVAHHDAFGAAAGLLR